MNLNLGDTQLIISTAKSYGILRNQLAYLLATAYWETAQTMKPVKEAFWLSENWRKQNLRYYPWYGRGYVQLTWKENYIRAGKECGKDFIKNPEGVMNPEDSAKILIVGSRDAWFRSGKNLSKYITLQKSNFFAAREIINGDKYKVLKNETRNIGTIIADYAREYEKDLKKIGYGENQPTQKPVQSVPKGPVDDHTKNNESLSTALLALFKWILAILRKK